ncbi:MAG: neutral/alkaline non-lysosomal ceramidase N-terminal domain-containing protein [Myxococcota bacterium]
MIPSHTHSAPGHFAGCRLYDVLNQWPGGTRDDVIDVIVDALLAAFGQALGSLVDAELVVTQHDASDLGRNRSIEAFKANFDHRGGWPPPGFAARQNDPNDEQDEKTAVDPRFWAVSAVQPDKTLIGTFAVIGVHNASVGRKHKYYHPDWAGLAADAIENNANLNWARRDPACGPRTGWAAVGQGPAGDVTAIPVGKDMRSMGLALANEMRDKVVPRWVDALNAPGTPSDDIELGFYRWRPRDDGLVTWDVGTPVILGCEESRTPFIFNPERGEARRVDAAMRLAQRIVAGAKGIINPAAIASEDDQLPKDPALGPAQLAIRKLLKVEPGDEHPVHLLRIGTHVFFGLPCEITTYASWKLEQALLARFSSVASGEGGAARKRVTSASPIAMVNDYMGYLTTRAEYEMQNYEGALNLYGKRTHEAIIAAVCDTVHPDGTLQVDLREPLELPEPLDFDEVEDRLKRVAGRLSWSARQALKQVMKVWP